MRLSVNFIATAALLAIPFASAQLTPNNLAATSTSGSLSALKYTKVGSTGSYDQVTNILPGTFPTCDVNPFCVTETKEISGRLRVSKVGCTSSCSNARVDRQPRAL